MQELNMLFSGFGALLNQPLSLLLSVLGVALGIVIGALPGLTATMGVAILLPFTFGMDPVPGLLMISGVFFGGIYGGSITAIMLNIPGTPAAAATAMDGYALTLQGKAGLALGTATISSFIGGFLSIILLVFMAPVSGRICTGVQRTGNLCIGCFWPQHHCQHRGRVIDQRTDRRFSWLADLHRRAWTPWVAFPVSQAGSMN